MSIVTVCNESRDVKDWIRNKSDEVALQKGCYFDYAAADRVRQFMHTFLTNTEAPFAGQPFRLLPWQWNQVIAPGFGWKMPDGTRRFKEIQTWIPKKNGKSTIAAAIALYLLIADGEYGASIYSAAGDRKQAALIYNVAAAMVKENPALRNVLKVRKHAKTIAFREMNSVYEVISAEGHRNEGYNIHGLLFDELHTQRNRKLWAALLYGGAARKQSLRFIISTAGELDEALLWHEQFTLALSIQNSETIDIHILPCVYALREDEDWRDESVWERVNPSYHHTLNHVEFRRAYENATKSAISESEFLRYRLNRATKFESAWIRNNYWIACGKYIPQQWTRVESSKLYAGCDLSDNMDLNAYVEGIPVQRETEQETIEYAVKVKAKFWGPSEAGLTSSRQNRERYEKWFLANYVKSIEGPIATQEIIEDDIVSLIGSRPVEEIGIDRYNASRFGYSMQKKFKLAKRKVGLRLVNYNYATMNEPVVWLQSLICSGRLLHDNDPVLDWMFSNCVCSTDSSGNKKLDKSTGKGKIDGFAAMSIMLFCMIAGMPTFKSRYEDPTIELHTVTV